MESSPERIEVTENELIPMKQATVGTRTLGYSKVRSSETVQRLFVSSSTVVAEIMQVSDPLRVFTP